MDGLYGQVNNANCPLRGWSWLLQRCLIVDAFIRECQTIPPNPSLRWLTAFLLTLGVKRCFRKAIVSAHSVEIRESSQFLPLPQLSLGSPLTGPTLTKPYEMLKLFHGGRVPLGTNLVARGMKSLSESPSLDHGPFSFLGLESCLCIRHFRIWLFQLLMPR